MVCSCGYKHRYGIPCRHLFSLEPEYDINDIDSRWQIVYALMAFTPGRDSLTAKFLSRETVEHSGLRRKSLTPWSGQFPYLLPLSKRTTEEILTVSNSRYPVCWNYQLKDYPAKYQETVDDDFSDSNEVWVDDDPENQDFTQESIGVGAAASMATQLHMPQVSVPQLFIRFKSMIKHFATPSSRLDLYNSLVRLEDERRRQQIVDNGNLVQPQDTEWTSLDLPGDKSKESTRFDPHKKTYKARSRKRKRR